MNYKKHTKLLISEKIPEAIENMLCDTGFELIKLRCEEALPAPVSSHADMLIFSDSQRLITTKKYYDANRDIFENINICTTDKEHSDKYPKDVILNCFVFSGALFGRLESVCENIRNLYPNRVNLSQGYAKCSTLLFCDHAVTSDHGIAKKLGDAGASVLLISPGSISLPGYNYGFIGGASFVYENSIIFFGDISSHPDFFAIESFIKGAGFELVYTKEYPLSDFGGAIAVNIIDKTAAL